jgi:hypothetical protein
MAFRGIALRGGKSGAVVERRRRRQCLVRRCSSSLRRRYQLLGLSECGGVVLAALVLHPWQLPALFPIPIPSPLPTDARWLSGHYGPGPSFTWGGGVHGAEGEEISCCCDMSVDEHHGHSLITIDGPAGTHYGPGAGGCSEIHSSQCLWTSTCSTGTRPSYQPTSLLRHSAAGPSGQ